MLAIYNVTEDWRPFPGMEFEAIGFTSPVNALGDRHPVAIGDDGHHLEGAVLAARGVEQGGEVGAGTGDEDDDGEAVHRSRLVTVGLSPRPEPSCTGRALGRRSRPTGREVTSR